MEFICNIILSLRKIVLTLEVSLCYDREKRSVPVSQIREMQGNFADKMQKTEWAAAVSEEKPIAIAYSAHGKIPAMKSSAESWLLFGRGRENRGETGVKLGITETLEHSCPEEWAEKHWKLGCTAVNFPLDCTASPGDIERYRAASAAYGLTIAEVGADPCRWMAGKGQQERLLFCKEQLRLAERIQARCCVISTQLGCRWEGPAHREGFSPSFLRRTAELLQNILDEVKPVHTSLALVPLPWMLPNSPESCLELAHMVARPAFRINLELIQLVNNPRDFLFSTELIERCFDLLETWIAVCRMGDLQLDTGCPFGMRKVTLGEGGLDLSQYLRRIFQTGQDLPLMVGPMTSREAYADSLEYLRLLLDSVSDKKW